MERRSCPRLPPSTVTRGPVPDCAALVPPWQRGGVVFVVPTPATAAGLQSGQARGSVRVCVSVRARSAGGGPRDPARRLCSPERAPCCSPGPDSPVSPVKELTHAVRKQQRALEERLEACLEELRRLCLREAVRAMQTWGSLGATFWGVGAEGHLAPGRILEIRLGFGAQSPCVCSV